MEAFALSRPVISTYIAGIPELVDSECGWLVPAGDVPALARVMAECLETHPDDLVRMGAVGRARVEAAHDVAANAAQLHALFQRVGTGTSPR
jgi:glycosyltransferase involved in cell wall biosynthesis